MYWIFFCRTSSSNVSNKFKKIHGSSLKNNLNEIHFKKIQLISFVSRTKSLPQYFIYSVAIKYRFYFKVSKIHKKI